ncbi:MAG: cold-shock protein [Nitriliruptorales bacterium]|nr:cold-shock protein [Nitriliruptorales bacterium]
MDTHGTVKWFNPHKGYGFIAQDGGGPDLFVHFSDIVGTGFRKLEDGDRVRFVEKAGRKGPQAGEVIAA